MSCTHCTQRHSDQVKQFHLLEGMRDLVHLCSSKPMINDHHTIFTFLGEIWAKMGIMIIRNGIFLNIFPFWPKMINVRHKWRRQRGISYNGQALFFISCITRKIWGGHLCPCSLHYIGSYSLEGAGWQPILLFLFLLKIFKFITSKVTAMSLWSNWLCDQQCLDKWSKK